MTALVFTGLAVAVGLLIAAFTALTARPGGSFGWPRWPARYPARARRRKDIDGDVRRCLTAMLRGQLVTEAEWDAACRRAGWRPGSEDEEAGT